MQEIEIKFPVEQPDALRSRLRSLGASYRRTVFENNLIFDDAAGTLRTRGELLRLRAADHVFLTFKRPLPGERYKIREEIQITASSFEDTRALLEALGYRVVARYQKERESWTLEGLEASLDRTPIGFYLELEGQPEQIEATAAALGFDPGRGITIDYLALYREYCRGRGREPGDMVFA